jgi:hypothetical protein
VTLHRAGRCPTCGKPVALNNQGRIRRHTDTREPKGRYARPVCDGFRQLPSGDRTERTAQ